MKLTFVDEDCNQEYEHKMQVIADSQKHTSDSLKAKYEQVVYNNRITAEISWFIYFVKTATRTEGSPGDNCQAASARRR